MPGDINVINPETEKFRHFPGTFHKKVVSIASYSDNEFAVSLYSEGLFIFNKSTGRLSPMTITDSGLIHQLRYNALSTNLCNENDGSLLLLVTDVLRLDKRSGTTETIPVSDGKPSAGALYLAGRDSLHTYFQGSKSIYRLRTGSHFLERIFRAGSGTVLNSAFLTPEGTMWLGTTDGIAKGIRDREFESIRSELFRDVKSVVADKSGLVWIGTDNGDIYMGGVQGLLHIDHGVSIAASGTPEITLNETYIDDVLTRPDKDLCIAVPHGSRMVQINVMAKEKDMFREKVYRFDVRGTGEDYFESFEPSLILRPLPPWKT